MPGVNSYRDLEVWKKAMQLVKHVYRLTSQLPESEKFGLVNQMNRAAVSIPSNIAEGSRRPTKDFIRFLTMASGSLAEIETQIELLARLKLIGRDEVKDAWKICTETGKAISGLKASLLKPKNYSAAVEEESGYDLPPLGELTSD